MKKRKSSGIGGQAVLEGIMMRNKDRFAVAVRKEDGEIAVTEETYEGICGKSSFVKAPVIRGVFSFIDSLVLGIRTINISASYFTDEEEEEKAKKQKKGKKAARDGEGSEGGFMALVVVISLVLAIGIFMLLPVWISGQFRRLTDNYYLTALLEGIIRVGIFVGYIVVVGRIKDIRRTYMYHGAEHKCINCIENGLALTPDNVMKSSKEHRRCGTSFMLYVCVISIFIFMFIRVDNIGLRMLSRICLIPVVAGVSYEFIRLAGSTSNPVILALSRPGLWMQALTTKEPEKDMVEVAVQAVEKVFDWREYQKEVFGTAEEPEAPDGPDEPEVRNNRNEPTDPTEPEGPDNLEEQ